MVKNEKFVAECFKYTCKINMPGDFLKSRKWNFNLWIQKKTLFYKISKNSSAHQFLTCNLKFCLNRVILTKVMCWNFISESINETSVYDFLRSPATHPFQTCDKLHNIYRRALKRSWIDPAIRSFFKARLDISNVSKWWSIWRENLKRTVCFRTFFKR